MYSATWCRCPIPIWSVILSLWRHHKLGRDPPGVGHHKQEEERRLLSHIRQLLDRRFTRIVYYIYPHQRGMGNLKQEV